MTVASQTGGGTPCSKIRTKILSARTPRSLSSILARISSITKYKNSNVPLGLQGYGRGIINWAVVNLETKQDRQIVTHAGGCGDCVTIGDWRVTVG